MADLSKLNPPQREAASHGGGPILVLAGAGSGKTRVITFRIAHLLAQGIPPTAICALTFTNKAAEEMRERIGRLLPRPEQARPLTMGTFHALGLMVLRSERRALGMPSGFVIYDQADQMGLLREAMRSLKDFGSGSERRFDMKAIASRISLAKNSFVSPDEFEPRGPDEYDHATQQIYPRYQELLRAHAAFDFDDLITEPVRLWSRDPACGERWAHRYRFVMVDEYQDTNRAQLMLVRHLVRDHQNLCVVGDDDQSIYSWRGADPSNILRFGDMFPGAKIVKLEQNYRSTKTILAAANAVIRNNKDRHGKTLWSDLGEGEIITHAVAATVEDEAKWLAREIVALQAQGRRWSDVAVLYRSNIQAKLVEEELRTHSVPYVMFGGQQFFERKEVKDVIAYLRVALNPRDDLAVRRVLNYPARGLGTTTLERLVQEAQATRHSLWHVLRSIANSPALPAESDAFDDDELAEAAFEPSVPIYTPPPRERAADEEDDDRWRPDEDAGSSWGGSQTPAVAEAPAAPEPTFALTAEPVRPAKRKGSAKAAAASGLAGELRAATRQAITDFVHVISELGATIENGGNLVDATKQLIDDIDLYGDLRRASPSQSAAARRIENVAGLLASLERQQARAPGRKALGEYLRQLSLASEEKEEVSGDKVVMTTLHGSKGLEFPVCFMIGVEEELLPHARTLNPQAADVGDPEHAADISEERRLCYVGITRAQRKLYLTRACTRISRGKSMPRTPSRFLLELPDELLEVRDLGEEAREKVPTTEVANFFASFSLDD